MAYTHKDRIRAAKEVTAIMTQLHDTMVKVAATCGEYLGISDDLSGAPLSGSEYMLTVERSLVQLYESYLAVREALVNVPDDA